MTYNWYKLFSLSEFMATGLVSRTLTVKLAGVGERDILITRGNTVGITYGDTFLPVEFEGRNPFVKDSLAVYLDAEGYVHLGIEVPE